MATVKMTKNGKTADIFDSAETIHNAQLEGWSFAEKTEKQSVQTSSGNDNERKNVSPQEPLQGLKKKSVLQNG